MKSSARNIVSRWGPLLAGAMALSGCSPNHSVLAPVTPEAGGIAQVWWVFFGVCITVYLVVMMLVLATAVKHRRAPEVVPPAPDPAQPLRDRRTHLAIRWGAIGTAVILLGLLCVDLWVQRGIAPRENPPLVIDLTGHQWWWSAEYQNSDASKLFETGNELHVPVGKPIRLLLSSQDVIHSFWVPRLHGKRDLVPGHPTSISFQIDQPGRFDGQCAEFCGLQHAHMGLIIFADEPALYEAWAEGQRSEAPPAATETQRRGRELFERGTCATCHTVHGTIAHSRVGPVLTHVASRETLGAGAAANNRAQLSAWILDPNHLKPGVRMPPNVFSPDDLNALLDFMETLK